MPAREIAFMMIAIGIVCLALAVEAHDRRARANPLITGVVCIVMGFCIGALARFAGM